jgi:hypothetical protein
VGSYNRFQVTFDPDFVVDDDGGDIAINSDDFIDSDDEYKPIPLRA